MVKETIVRLREVKIFFSHNVQEYSTLYCPQSHRGSTHHHMSKIEQKPYLIFYILLFNHI